jgi:hypothetical protein
VLTCPQSTTDARRAPHGGSRRQLPLRGGDPRRARVSGIRGSRWKAGRHQPKPEKLVAVGGVATEAVGGAPTVPDIGAATHHSNGSGYWAQRVLDDLV